ncbi:hypothetical protein AOLI_G00059380 [Acnodon oligacanthus]
MNIAADEFIKHALPPSISLSFALFFYGENRGIGVVRDEEGCAVLHSSKRGQTLGNQRQAAETAERFHSN